MSTIMRTFLLNDDEISQVQVIGYAPIIISIEIDEEQLLRYNQNFDLVSLCAKKNSFEKISTTNSTYH